MKSAKAPASRSERTRTAILTAGEAVFLELGYERASMDRIAEAAGVTKQTVYSYVASKEALFLDVIDRMTGGAGDALADVVEDPAADVPPPDFLQKFAEQQMQIVLTPRLMQLRRMVIGEAWRFPDLGALLYARGPQRSIQRLGKVLAFYAKAGELAIDDPLAAAASFNWLIMGGPTNDAMLLGDKAIPNRSTQRKHAIECVRIFMTAFGAPRGRD